MTDRNESTNDHRPERPNIFDQNTNPISFKAVNWGRLFAYLRPYWKRMALAVLALLISSGSGLAFPLVIMRLLDSVTKAKSYTLLNNLALLLVGIFLLQAAFNFIQSYLLTYIGEHIVYDLRNTLYKHLHQLSLDFYAVRRVGEIVSRLSSDVTQVRSMLTTNITGLLSQIVSLIGSIVIVMTLNAHLTLFILAVAPVLILVAFFFGSRIHKASVGIQDQLAGSTTVAEEGLQGIRVVKSFGRESFETQRYNSALEKTFRASLRMAVYNSSFTSVMMFLGFQLDRSDHVGRRAGSDSGTANAGDDHRFFDVRDYHRGQPGRIRRVVCATAGGPGRRAACV